MNKNDFKKASEILKKAKRITAFTGAGISVESGIPSFRGEDGIWKKYDPSVLEIENFTNNPKKSWSVIKELFYTKFKDAKPNAAHKALVELEKMHKLRAIITQNIDNLHQKAGSTNVYEFHGNSQKLVCLKCGEKFNLNQVNLDDEIFFCPKCSGLLKPDFVFFGESIPSAAYNSAVRESQICDLFMIIGTSGEVFPAAIIPHTAKEHGAVILEINKSDSSFTDTVTDIFLKGNAVKILKELLDSIT